MKIFVIGQDWFVDDFRKMGHEVVTAGTRDHLQYKLEAQNKLETQNKLDAQNELDAFRHRLRGRQGPRLCYS